MLLSASRTPRLLRKGARISNHKYLALLAILMVASSYPLVAASANSQNSGHALPVLQQSTSSNNPTQYTTSTSTIQTSGSTTSANTASTTTSTQSSSSTSSSSTSSSSTSTVHTTS